ncbi:MFS transporter [Pseudonocardiaceae bacterium YIM PH 21723]|nr:MFS transporter [Pseudonocardiaceae bacterium YIM PH 21723]
MPFVIYVLALAVFAQGTSEFMLSGLLPAIATDLRVPLSAAGTLTSAFALGMIIGAPLVAVLSMRWPRRRALLGCQLVFVITHVLGALTDSFALLLVTRVIAALVNAGFLAVGLGTVVTLVAADVRGRATSVLISGVTVACVAGVPLGALLGDLYGWRAAFWAVAILAAVPLPAILFAVPVTAAGAPVPGVRREIRVLPRMTVLLVLAALSNGATFCAFTYLAPVVTDVAGLSASWVPVALALFGVGSFLGVTVSGRFADRAPWRVSTVGAVLVPVGWLGFAWTAGEPVAAIGWLPVLGTLSFAVGATLISRALIAGEDAPTLAGGVTTAAVNVGAVLGPVLGGVALVAGYRAPLLVSAGLAVVALAVLRWSRHR